MGPNCARSRTIGHTRSTSASVKSFPAVCTGCAEGEATDVVGAGVPVAIDSLSLPRDSSLRLEDIDWCGFAVAVDAGRGCGLCVNFDTCPDGGVGCCDCTGAGAGACVCGVPAGTGVGAPAASGLRCPTSSPLLSGEGLNSWHSFMSVSSTKNCLFDA